MRLESRSIIRKTIYAMSALKSLSDALRFTLCQKKHIISACSSDLWLARFLPEAKACVVPTDNMNMLLTV